VLRREATNTKFIVFGLTRPGLKPAIYHTRDEHANHRLTIDAISHCDEDPNIVYEYISYFLQTYKIIGISLV